MIIETSAPAKVILFGEHGVNRDQPALATAVDHRVYCQTAVRDDEGYTFRSGERYEEGNYEGLRAFRAEIDGLRRDEALDEISNRAGEFFAPARYVLAHVLKRAEVPGLDVEWRSDLPVGSGLGAGAAAMSSLALAALRAAVQEPESDEIAFLAWQGDVIAHGGVASGLDSGACALGGLTRYTLTDGPQPLPYSRLLSLVIGDTQVSANTAKINSRVRSQIEKRPAWKHLFSEMGMLVEYAAAALGDGDTEALGSLMNLNQLLLQKLGVSCDELEELIEAAMGAGALGAKLSGSGGGGIMVALTEPDRQAAVAAAIDKAGGHSMIADANATGVRVESAGNAANDPE